MGYLDAYFLDKNLKRIYMKFLTIKLEISKINYYQDTLFYFFNIISLN